MKKNLMIILSVAIPLITACKQEPVINFSEDSVDNIYLTCKERGKEYWRNVIIDKINKSIKSEKYFIASYDNKVYQYGKIASLSDQGEYYYWSEPEDKMYYSFRLDRTSLKMTVDAWFNEDFSYKYFNCTKHLDYSYFKDKEKNIIDKLTKEAKRKEEAKKNMSRPSWNPTLIDCDKAREMASRGLTAAQIASCLGISETTLYKKQNEYAEFMDAIKRGRAEGINQVSNALFEKATQGNVTAMIYYLKTRDRENWGENQPEPLKQIPPMKIILNKIS